jgi:katanin p60 ATPase-containing subunit A1
MSCDDNDDDGVRIDEIDSPITQEDFDEALRRVQSSVGKLDLEKYDKWMEEYGSK